MASEFEAIENKVKSMALLVPTYSPGCVDSLTLPHLTMDCHSIITD